ncbi:MAG: hypothetical protein HGB22_01165, partial [Chlorobiaceae bacterium]|nr:hypothetical protein [Chlorobiaceae bacterium]
MYSRSSDQRNEWLFAVLLSIAFAVTGGFIAAHHEMWRDELQAWLLARDSADLHELFRNLKYEGHPGLWHLLLMPLTRLSGSPVSMQVLHLGIATMSVYVLARYAPFSRLQRALLAFGYYPFYEYAIISRNYGIGVLFIYIFCACFEKRHTRLIPIAITLVLLSHTSVMGVIISIVLSGALFFDFLVQREELAKVSGFSCSRYWLALLIVFIGVASSIFQMIPPPDTGYAVPWHFRLNINSFKQLRLALSGAYAPLPVFETHFWNTQAIMSNGIATVAYWCFMAVFGYLFLRSLAHKPVAMFVFAGCTLGLLSFFYIKYFGSFRHHGFLFITLVMTAWIRPYTDRTPPSSATRVGSPWADRLLSRLFTVIIGFQVIAAI